MWKVLPFLKILIKLWKEKSHITTQIFTSEIMVLPDEDYVEISLEYVNNAA